MENSQKVIDMMGDRIKELKNSLEYHKDKVIVINFELDMYERELLKLVGDEHV